MTEIRFTSLTVRRHQAWDDSPTLNSWTIQEEPSTRISYPWKPRVQAVPKRLRKTECREVFTSHTQSPLPSIHVHGPQCRCTQSQTSEQHQDELLAQQIASLTEKTLLTRPTAPRKMKPPPAHSHRRSRPVSVTVTTSLSLLYTLNRLARLFTPLPPAPSPPLQADLCLACANLDIDKVSRYLLHESPPLPVNEPNHQGLTPLMAAVRSRLRAPRAQREMVRFLVEACGADVNASRVDRVTGLGESVLSMACARGLVEVVRYLVGKGAEVKRRLPCGSGFGRGLLMGQTALHVAVLADRAECVEVLAREGKADVNAVFDGVAGDRGGGGLEGSLKGLRGRTRSVSRESRRKRPRHPVSALHLAHGSAACSRVLLQCGADVDARDGYGRTPLHWAAESSNADVVRLLVDAGADVSAILKHGTDSSGHLSEAMGMLAKEDSESVASTMVR
ncbi:ankyrin repeat-containing domain protein [Achaetomium macrosporum]|uniref:Ankyrin repeat-containing domain protein n=1 Tax=Achaetomium macrosporum TaxID=79813 RepID=A0AAN7HCT3_9PEZI|nr:ankyrin repeat-containing domain protein [Achaetomium macrosporum]